MLAAGGQGTVLRDRCLSHFKFQRAIQQVVQVQVNFIFPRWLELVVSHVEQGELLLM